jgi:hypothetical protein
MITSFCSAFKKVLVLLHPPFIRRQSFYLRSFSLPSFIYQSLQTLHLYYAFLFNRCLCMRFDFGERCIFEHEKSLWRCYILWRERRRWYLLFLNLQTSCWHFRDSTLGFQLGWFCQLWCLCLGNGTFGRVDNSNGEIFTQMHVRWLIDFQIVDECPNCGLNHLDLFPDAFAALANPTTGVIAVGWEYIDCPITSALQVHNKEGVSAYWFSMQVVNANKAVASLEVSTDDGRTWQSTTRATYNFFENSSGFGTSTVDVKITSVDGDVVIVNDVAVTSDSTTTASGNFGNSGVGASVMAPITSSSSIALASTSIEKVSAYILETSSSTRMAFSPSAQTPAAASTSTPVGGSFQQTSPVLTSFSTSTTAGVSTAATPSPSISEMFAATLPSSAPGVVYVYVNACPA